jgi:hypothetical protein
MMFPGHEQIHYLCAKLSENKRVKCYCFNKPRVNTWKGKELAPVLVSSAFTGEVLSTNEKIINFSILYSINGLRQTEYSIPQLPIAE